MGGDSQQALIDRKWCINTPALHPAEQGREDWEECVNTAS